MTVRTLFHLVMALTIGLTGASYAGSAGSAGGGGSSGGAAGYAIRSNSNAVVLTNNGTIAGSY
jgi:hypothetical protein